MSNWKPIDSAPHDGTWIKAKGRDFGLPGNKSHYAIAFYDSGNWNEVGSEGGILLYLTEWKPLNEPATDSSGDQK